MGTHDWGIDTWGGENAQLGTAHEEGKYSTEMARRKGKHSTVSGTWGGETH